MSKLVNEMSEIKMSQLKKHQERIKELNGSTMKKSFWYSVKQHELYQSLGIKVNYIIGFAYTVMTDVGELPSGNFDDYTIVFENLEFTYGDIEINHF